MPDPALFPPIESAADRRKYRGVARWIFGLSTTIGLVALVGVLLLVEGASKKHPGVVIAREHGEVKAPVEGRVARIVVADGASVRSGDVVAELESDQLDEEIAQLQFEVRAARINEARARLTAHQDSLSAIERLTLSEVRVRVADGNLREAKVEFGGATDSSVAIDTSASTGHVALLRTQSALTEARQLLSSAQAWSRLPSPSTLLAEAERTRVRSLEERLRRALDRRALHVATAPVSGEFLAAEPAIREGAYVRAGESLGSVRSAHRQVLMDLDPSARGDVEVGDSVVMVVPRQSTARGQRYHGVIATIRPLWKYRTTGDAVIERYRVYVKTDLGERRADTMLPDGEALECYIIDPESRWWRDAWRTLTSGA